jgi:tetratricopeptide (TPR) repeat protein
MNRRDEAIVEWRKLLKVDAKNHDAALQLSGLLMAEGKNSEAIAVLEDAVKATPDSSSLNKALGGAYLQDNQMDKGIPYLEKTLRDEKEIDPGTLNDAAYMLADKNSHLDLAKEYAEKAVAELDRRSAEAAKNNDPDGFVLASAYAATWDTVGWVYFQAGDFTRAEDYLHAAWTLGQGGEAGDHLGQAYEKLGKKKEAEHIYIQALSAQYVPAVSAPAQFANQSEVYKKTRNSILAHYEKLTGRKQPPPVAINRLPNGQWTKTPSDELLDKRRAHVTKSSHLTGSCDFEMIFAPGKVESVHYLSGTTELKDVGDQLQETKFETLFPAGSGARIFRRVTVTCSSTSGCNAEMVPPNQGIVMSRRKSVQMTDD